MIATFSAIPSPLVKARCRDRSLVAFSSRAAINLWYIRHTMPARVIGRFSPGLSTIGTLEIRDVAPFLKSLGDTPDKSHRFICVTRSVLLIACTCASLILSGPGAPFLALHSTLVALDSVTTSNRSSFSGYAIAGVLLSSSEGGSDKVFQNGITLSRGRLLDSSAHVPRMTTLAVSDWRSRQSPWSLAYLSRFACLLLIFLPSSFLVWAAFCPFRLFTFLARNLRALGALCFIRSSSLVSQALYSSETVGSLQKRFGLRISNATQLVAHCGGEIRELS